MDSALAANLSARLDRVERQNQGLTRQLVGAVALVLVSLAWQIISPRIAEAQSARQSRF